MNIFLVPYTWARHVVAALVVGGAALLFWWIFLVLEVIVAPTIGVLWALGWEGAFLLGFGSATIAASSVLVEASLRRLPLSSRLLRMLGAGGFALIVTMMGYGLLQLIQGALASEAMATLVTDPSYVSLRFRFLQWAVAGFASGLGPLAVRIVLTRKFGGILDHLGGGLAAGLLGAAAWHAFGYYGIGFLGIPPDMYLAPAMGLLVWGTLHGLLVWGVPDELYAGWLRVLSSHRFGHRIPIDRVDGGPSERFVGHFPRGLDLFVPAEKGVAELHVSFTTDGKQHHAIRGLSQQPIELKRFLERVDLRYDPRRPAPLETDMRMEDRIFLSTADGKTELEFLLLPKEEQ